MTDPITSQYDKDPVNTKPDLGDGKKEPDPPPDLGNTQSPDLEVWSSRPSFNTKPTRSSQDGGSAPKNGGPPVGGFHVHLESVATQLNTMLGTSRELVTEYESLRAKVIATEGAIWGQHAKSQETTYHHTTSGMVGDGPSGEPSRWADPAKKFAERMNPAQEKALQHIGSMLELVGEYIAMANHSGQLYAESDRKSRFPAPPGK